MIRMNDADNDDLNKIADDPTKSPAIVSEEVGSEPMDIDSALEAVGLPGDKEGVKPLDLEDELEEE